MRVLRYVAVLLLVACSAQEPPSAPRPQPERESAASASPALTPAATPSSGPLQRAVGLTFGLPLPQGLQLVQRSEDVAEFVTDHSAASLNEFYRRELPGHRPVERPDGTKFEALDEDRADVYIVANDDRRRVFYFRAEGALPEIGLEPRQLAEPTEPRRAPEFRLGPAAAPGVDAFLSPVEAGSDSGTYYDERYEEVDGQRVRILTVRDPTRPRQPAEPSGSPSAQTPAQLLPQWHRLPQNPGRGSYDRGDGHRSLRATPRRGPDGEPLPFLGSRRVAFDPDTTLY